MQIKTTVDRYPLTPFRWLSSKIQEITNVGKDMERKGTFVHCWCEYKLVAATMGNSVGVPQ